MLRAVYLIVLFLIGVYVGFFLLFIFRLFDQLFVVLLILRDVFCLWVGLFLLPCICLDFFVVIVALIVVLCCDCMLFWGIFFHLFVCLFVCLSNT